MKSIANKLLLKSQRLLCVYFILLAFSVYSQHKVGKYAYKWALVHPFAAIKIKKELKHAMIVYHTIKTIKQLDTLEVGGKLDAFRHTYTMAYLSRFVKVKKLRTLGIAHEKDNKRDFYGNKNELTERADSLLCEMDLRNNELGFFIGTTLKKADPEKIKNTVIDEIKMGNAWYLKRNFKNEYLTCDGEIIEMSNFYSKWFVPKCLIKSNE